MIDIYGLQKLTLLDYPGHTACTVFLPGCNFDCPYCHNRELARHKVVPIMIDEKFMSWLLNKKGLLDGVCITGGEPTLHEGLHDLIHTIKDNDFLVKLDTNGYKPLKLMDVIYYDDVDYIAMDIKNSSGKYSLTAGVEVDMSKIYWSIDIIRNSTVDYEFRTTVTKSMHDDSDFEEIGRLLKGAKRYFLQKCTTDTPDDESMQRYKAIMERYVKHVEIRG